jgi:hypothetical protein
MISTAPQEWPVEEEFAPVVASQDEAAEDFQASPARDRTIPLRSKPVARRRGDPPGRTTARHLRLLLDDWFHRDDFEPFSSINVMIEMGQHTVRNGPASSTR